MSKSFWLALLVAPAALATGVAADPPMNCDACAEWNAPREPFRIWGNSWFVGTQGLSSVLITSRDGHVLIDGGLPQSAPLIAANIEKLGFHVADIRLIVNSHTHYDHAGGIAALQRASGAAVAASPAARRALERGGPEADDPQFGFGPEHNDYAPVQNVREVADGETLRVGPLAITAHFTPGHTPGGTSWTWTACDRDECRTLDYVDSLGPVAAPGFRFTGDATHASRVPAFEKSIAAIAALECGILVAPHPEQFGLDARLAEARRRGLNFLPGKRTDCRDYAERARARLAQRIAEESKPATP